MLGVKLLKEREISPNFDNALKFNLHTILLNGWNYPPKYLEIQKRCFIVSMWQACMFLLRLRRLNLQLKMGLQFDLKTQQVYCLSVQPSYV